MNDLFHKVAVKVSQRVGSPATFMIAVILIGAWLLTGLANGFTDTWLLLINTSCSVVTFLIVFLIQNSQNRQSRAMQLKLDELLKSIRTARTDLVSLEDLTDGELDDLEHEFKRLRMEFVERQATLIERKAARHGSHQTVAPAQAKATSVK